MAMTSFQSSSLAVAGGSCGLAMWDLVVEKRICSYEPPTSTSRPTAICQVTLNFLHISCCPCTLLLVMRLTRSRH
jgi:hypothetical protein